MGIGEEGGELVALTSATGCFANGLFFFPHGPEGDKKEEWGGGE